MSRASIILTCILLISYIEISEAQSPETPTVANVDSLPCNYVCQTYTAWSRRIFGQSAASQLTTSENSRSGNVPRGTRNNVAKKLKPARIARGGAQKKVAGEWIGNAKLTPYPLAANPGLRPSTAAQATLRKIETAREVVRTQTVEEPTTAVSNSPRLENETTNERLSSVQSVTAASHFQSIAGATSGPRLFKRPPEQALGIDAKAPDAARTTSAVSSNTTVPAPTRAGQLVAVLFVRAGINVVSDLSNKVVAIDASDPASRIRSAIVLAGAANVELSESDRMALSRVLDGEVPAAVVSLESAQAAAKWTELPGLSVFRIPLAPISADTVPE